MGTPPAPGQQLAAGYPAATMKQAAEPVAVPVSQLEVEHLEERSWTLECIYAIGLGPEAFWALPSRVRTLSLPSCAGSPRILGRTHQKEMFEALLSHEPNMLVCISRSHVQVEEVSRKNGNSNAAVSIDSTPQDEMPPLLITNLSQNVIVASQVNEASAKALYQNDTAELRDGDTLSFAKEQHAEPAASETAGGGTPRSGASAAQTQASSAPTPMATRRDVVDPDGAEANIEVVPFLTFRVTAPPAPPPPSPSLFVMMSPPSLTISVVGSEIKYNVEPAQEFVSMIADESMQSQGLAPVASRPMIIGNGGRMEPARASLVSADVEANNTLRRSATDASPASKRAQPATGSVPTERVSVTAPKTPLQQSTWSCQGFQTQTGKEKVPDQCVSQ